MSSPEQVTVKEVQATRFRQDYRRVAASARGRKVVRIVNRRQKPKYLVDQDFFEGLLRDRRKAKATLEVLADPSLTERLLKLAETVDQNVNAGRLYSMEEVFGET
jgi:hypothetical protein